MTIIGVYLLPENSFHDRDGDVVFNYINALFYQYLDEWDIVLLCGDIIARIGNVNDVKEDFNVLRIASRLTCDNITNKWSRKTISWFLYDNDISCVLNSRWSPKCAAITGVGVDMSPHCFIKFPNGSASYTASGSKV